MTCEGCSKAVTRVLTKLEGVISVEANIETKIVKVIITLQKFNSTIIIIIIIIYFFRSRA